MNRPEYIRLALFLATAVCAVVAESSPVARIRSALRVAAVAPEAVVRQSAPELLVAQTQHFPRAIRPATSPLRPASLPGFRADAALSSGGGATVPSLGNRGFAIAATTAVRLHPSVVQQIDEGAARHLVAALAYDLLQEGRAAPRSPEWRPHLAELVAHPLSDVDSVALYHLFLASFEGVDSMARTTMAETWAARYDGGRYAGSIALAGLRSIFQSGDYAEVESRAVRVAAAHPDQAVAALSLRILCLVYRNDFNAAEAAVSDLRRDFTGTTDEPEVLYLAAWVRIEQNRIDEARALLENILVRFPETATAKKAHVALEELLP